MKIGITCFPLIGGSGILATALGMELAARGHEIHFFSYAKPVRLDLTAPRIYFHEVAIGEHSVFPCPDYTLPLAVKMAEIGRAEKLDLFHVHYAVPHATAAFLAKEMIGENAPKIVTTLHGTDTTLLGPNPQYHSAIAHALRHSDAVTTVSESLRRQTLETFQLERPVEVIPNFFAPGVPTRSREEVRRKLNVTDDHLLVLHMSNLRPTKRIDFLLRTLAATKNRARIRLLILPGASFAEYEPLLDEIGIRENVIVHVPDDPIENYLQASDAGLYTSEIESFGLSILETMFFAKPVLAFRVGGIAEVMGDIGFLADFGDTASLAVALDKLAEFPAVAQSVGEAGQARANTFFTASKVVPRYEELYQQFSDRDANADR